jgi:hypothetical protein
MASRHGETPMRRAALLFAATIGAPAFIVSAHAAAPGKAQFRDIYLEP